jgi:hypothetical protein
MSDCLFGSGVAHGQGSFCGKDPDDVFAYPTRKIVKIRDWRLGVTRMILMISILVYIVVYRIFYNQAYLEKFTPLGAANFHLSAPTELSDESDPGSGCNPLDASAEKSCRSAIRPVDTLDYCSQSPEQRAFKKYNCTVRDGFENAVVYQSAILIGSRVTTYSQERMCPVVPTGGECAGGVWQKYRPEQSVFVAGIEDFQLLVDHSFTCSEALQSAGIRDISGQSRNMRGTLRVDKTGPHQDAICRRHYGTVEEDPLSAPAGKAPCFLVPNRTFAAPNTTSAVAGLDVFRVGTLLSAAGTSFEDESLSLGGTKHTNRFNGLQLAMYVSYRNKDAHWNTHELPVSYTYRVEAVLNGTFDYSQDLEYSPPAPPPDAPAGAHAHSLAADGAGLRALRLMHGVRVSVVFTGDLGRFSFAQLLVTLTTSLALFAMATTLTDLLATKVMPLKTAYSNAKYQRTVDFSDLEELLARGEEELLQRLQDNGIRPPARKDGSTPLPADLYRVRLATALLDHGVTAMDGDAGADAKPGADPLTHPLIGNDHLKAAVCLDVGEAAEHPAQAGSLGSEYDQALHSAQSPLTEVGRMGNGNGNGSRSGSDGASVLAQQLEVAEAQTRRMEKEMERLRQTEEAKAHEEQDRAQERRQRMRQRRREEQRERAADGDEEKQHKLRQLLLGPEHGPEGAESAPEEAGEGTMVRSDQPRGSGGRGPGSAGGGGGAEDEGGGGGAGGGLMASMQQVEMELRRSKGRPHARTAHTSDGTSGEADARVPAAPDASDSGGAAGNGNGSKKKKKGKGKKVQKEKKEHEHGHASGHAHSHHGADDAPASAGGDGGGASTGASAFGAVFADITVASDADSAAASGLGGGSAGGGTPASDDWGTSAAGWGAVASSTSQVGVLSSAFDSASSRHSDENSDLGLF